MSLADLAPSLYRCVEQMHGCVAQMHIILKYIVMMDMDGFDGYWMELLHVWWILDWFWMVLGWFLGWLKIDFDGFWMYVWILFGWIFACRRFEDYVKPVKG